MERDTHFVTGVFEDEDVLLQAIKQVRSSGIKIHEVYSPYPVHGIDDYLGYKRSKLPIAAFLF
ncbi:quinol:electron acceptor oxidoreductase subunit ActD, partial [Algoriphagus sp.]